MRKRTIFAVVPAVLTALTMAHPAIAQTASATAKTTEAELAALRARVAALESTTTNGLSFSLTNGTTIQLYGYIKGDLIYDNDFDLGSTTFGLTKLGLPGGPAAGSTTRGQAKQSRFGLKINSGQFRAKVEGDFFAASNAFRLRHAYGQWNGILVGQTWSNFMPLSSYPSTIDFEGPVGLPFSRVQQVRYTYDSGAGLSVSGSVEADVKGTSTRPAITGAAEYGFDRGTVRLAGITRNIVLGGAEQTSWSITLGGSAQLWQGGTLLGNYTTGEANSDLLVSGLSGTAQFVAGQKVTADGITLGVSQDIGDQFTVAAAYGRTRMDIATGIDTRQLESIHVSAWYKPVKNVSFGLEYFTGTRTQGNGAEFTADRVQFAGQFNF